VQGKDHMRKLTDKLMLLAGCVLVLTATSTSLLAGGYVTIAAVPEIDAGTASSAIALLLGGSFIAISKLRRK